MHLILTGATGLVGSAALQHMLALETVTKVSILTRRPVAMAEGHPKVNTIIHKDFSTYPPEILEQLKGAEGCVWAQGISITSVSSAEEYEKITVKYPLAAAEAFTSLHDPFKFVYVSGEGATATPTYFTSTMGRIKGTAESSLLAWHKSHTSFLPYSVRPGFVDPSRNPEIKPFIPALKPWIKAVTTVIGPGVRTFYPPLMSPTKELGKVLVELAMGEGKPLEGKGVDGEGRTLANVALRRLAGL